MFYTYLLKCLPTNEYYYGVRYSKNSSPDEFWRTYFTSSIPVKERIELFGKENFIYEIRKTFDCPIKARAWEDKVLRRINAVERANFLNKSYGVPFSSRSSKAGKKMMFFFEQNTYKYVNSSLVEYLIKNNVATPKGKPKPADFGSKLSKTLKGKKKTKEHIANMSRSLKGKNVGKSADRFGEERSLEISNKLSKKLKNFYQEHVHPSLGKTYEEIYGIDKASKIKRIRSTQLKESNPAIKIKGKTYEEVYGEEKARDLKRIRSKVGKQNTKKYIIYVFGIQVFQGNRTDAANFITSTFSLPPSNILYNTPLLEKNNIKVETLPTRR